MDIVTVEFNSTCPTDILYAFAFNSTLALSSESAKHVNILLTVAPYVLLAISIISALFGHRVIKPVCAMIGFITGSFSAMHFLSWQTFAEVSCDVQIVMVILSASAIAILATCLVRVACFLIGALTGAGLAFMIFFIFPTLDRALWADAPFFMGHSVVPFWVSIGASALVVGYVCKREHRRVLIFITSALGAWGVAISMRILLQVNSHSHPEWLFYVIFGSVFIVGASTQWYIDYRRRKKKNPPPPSRKGIRFRRSRSNNVASPSEIELEP